eukprot:513283-Pelagomonas_calceolata.AAC.1
MENGWQTGSLRNKICNIANDFCCIPGAIGCALLHSLGKDGVSKEIAEKSRSAKLAVMGAWLHS